VAKILPIEKYLKNQVIKILLKLPFSFKATSVHVRFQNIDQMSKIAVFLSMHASNVTIKRLMYK
jgi:hypothetical protein